MEDMLGIKLVRADTILERLRSGFSPMFSAFCFSNQVPCPFFFNREHFEKLSHSQGLTGILNWRVNFTFESLFVIIHSSPLRTVVNNMFLLLDRDPVITASVSCLCMFSINGNDLAWAHAGFPETALTVQQESLIRSGLRRRVEHLPTFYPCHLGHRPQLGLSLMLFPNPRPP